MKMLTVPSSGRQGQAVFYKSRFGQCSRQYIVPADPASPAQQHRRAVFGYYARLWSRLTEGQRDRWNVAGPRVMSDPRAGQRGPLTGQQHYEQVCCILSTVGIQGPDEPPQRPAFQPNPVGELVITNDGDGVRLWLKVSGPLTEMVMVFGQEPCSAGRTKRRNVCFLGLLPPPVGGLSEITALYKARYGTPRAGRKVFIVTCQQKDGWKDVDHQTSEIVPDLPESRQATAQPVISQIPLMYMGCTRAIQGAAKPPASGFQGAAEGGTEGETAGEAPPEGKAGGPEPDAGAGRTGD